MCLELSPVLNAVCAVSLASIMKTLPVLVLLFCTVQLYSAAPPLEPVTCSIAFTAAVRMATHHINEQHQHGYKFKYTDEGQQNFKIEKNFGGCNIELQFDLMETVCNTNDLKHFEECDERGENDGAVKSTCTVTMTVTNGVAKVNKHVCNTQQAMSAEDKAMTCPGCPSMIALTNTEGLNEALQHFNNNPSNLHQYILKEVGRMRAGYIMRKGTVHYGEFVLVESNCRRGTTENCTPLCPLAHHAVCRASYSKTSGLLKPVECDHFPPTKNAGPGDTCPPPVQHCASSDPAIHAICDWTEPAQQ